MNSAQLERLAREQFGLRPIAPIKEMSAGNVKRSAVVETDDGAVVLQEMNHTIFAEPAALMGNIEKIIERMLEHNMPALSFLRTVDGAWLASLDDAPWRCYRYVDGAATPRIETPEDAQSTARAFGRFARAIDGLDLAEHLSGYHDFDQRVTDMELVIAADELERAADCAGTIQDLMGTVDRLRLSSSYDALRRVPVRNAHNDAKGPNCIIGPTGARTIIDLDTTMPGTVLSDIGEMVRSSTRSLSSASPAEYMTQIESVNRGFLAGYGVDLSVDEREAMLLAGPLMAVENAARFLTDHLSGDKYYGASSPNQNMERAIAQLQLGKQLIAAIEWATTG
ncbi:MAG: phosphotransferase enzyme family protein [Acidimicrobiales bacterium]